MTQLLNKVRSYFPTPLPTTYNEYNTWLADIVELTGPIADKESLEWVISNEVMRQPTGKDRIAKHTFVKLIRKFAANQFAANKVNEIKNKQQEAAKAQAEVTAAQQKAATSESAAQETAKQ